MNAIYYGRVGKYRSAKVMIADSRHRRPARPQSLFGRVGLAGAVLSAAFLAWPAAAQTAQTAAGGLPPVPTTRILAIGHMTSKATPAGIRAVMPDEVRETVKLYLTGRIAEWYTRKDSPGVVFILNLHDAAEAHALLERLPLGQAGLMSFDLVPLGPLSPLGVLVGPVN